MRRVIIAVLTASFGTTLLIGLKTQGLGAPLGLTAGAPLDPAVDGGDGQPGPVPPPGDPGPSASTTTPGPAATSSGPTAAPKPGSTQVKPTATTPGGGSPPSTTSTTAPPTTATYTGAAIAVKTAQSPTTKSSSCGDCHAYSMSVTITVTAGRVTRASVAYSTSPGSSLSYASRANTSLSQKILTAQTWNLGRVSGATYSGNAWELSVRDAMTKAGLPT